jgi:hypothetical protein
VRVLTVREILAHGVDEHMGARVALEGLAADTLQYKVGRPPSPHCFGGSVSGEGGGADTLQCKVGRAGPSPCVLGGGPGQGERGGGREACVYAVPQGRGTGPGREGCWRRCFCRCRSSLP